VTSTASACALAENRGRKFHEEDNPFLWFDSEAEQAGKFYVGIFKNSKIGKITHYGEDGPRRKVGDCELQASKSNEPVTFLHFTETGRFS
jgi:predicted 3-demethylubiquinone-9 3-methyltransferase (glyoxalase superfamily)